LALSLGVYGLATAVQTDREQIIGRTESFVAALWPVDEAALRDHLAPRAVLLGPDGSAWDQLSAEFVAFEMRQHRVEETALRSVDAAARPGADGIGRSSMDVASRVADGFPAQTTWAVEWQRQADGRWQITALQWLTFRNQEPSKGWY
jgi:ketosteroid isomerase-like protein